MVRKGETKRSEAAARAAPLVSPGGWEGPFEAAARRALEPALPGYLATRR